MSDEQEAVGVLNLNTFVLFKMQPRGVEIAKNYWESIGMAFPNAAFTVDQPHVECRQQFHQLFRMFGGRNMKLDMDGSPIYGLTVLPMP